MNWMTKETLFLSTSENRNPLLLVKLRVVKNLSCRTLNPLIYMALTQKRSHNKAVLNSFWSSQLKTIYDEYV
jgi:hypothetical protein